MTSVAALLASICEQETPEAVLDGVPSDEGLHTLIAQGALVPAGARESVTCLACDEPHEALVEYHGDGKYLCFCPEAGLFPVEACRVQRYIASLSWIATQVSNGLGQCVAPAPTILPIPTLLRIGQFRFKHERCLIFAARRQFVRRVWERTEVEVHNLQGDLPAILVSTTSPSRLPSPPNGRLGVVSLTDVLELSADRPLVDEGPFVSLLRGAPQAVTLGGLGYRISPDFRHVEWREKTYQFTRTQARVIEILHNARNRSSPRVLQSVIQASIGSSQRIGQLFKNHPAYQSLILHDNHGYYWLRLDPE